MKLDLGHVKLDKQQITYELDQSTGWYDHTSRFLATFDNIALGLSGGADSEALAEILYRNDIAFVPVIFDYMGANQHDTAYAIRWCNLRNKDYKIIEIDPKTIWEDVDGCLELASISNCVSPQYLIYMHMYMELTNHGTPIMAIGEPEIAVTNQGRMLVEKSMHFSVELFKQHHNLLGTSLPFQKNQSAMSSWINDSFWNIIQTGQDSKWYKADWYKEKLGIMKRVKRDGFENLRAEDRKLRQLLEQQWPEETKLIKTKI